MGQNEKQIAPVQSTLGNALSTGATCRVPGRGSITTNCQQEQGELLMPWSIIIRGIYTY